MAQVMSLAVAVRPHPLLELGAFVSRFARPLGELVLPEEMAARAAAAFAAHGGRDDAAAVRDLLRAGGFKPSGRSKPASEYLVAAHAEGRFPAINAAVDACNLASLYGGLPISLVDVDRLSGASELYVGCAPAATSYVFNPSGQTIDASNLLCLFDAAGPTGTPVKDAQRTKTHAETRATLSVIWGTRALAGRAAAVTAWYRAAVEQIEGATTEDVAR
jgi:DNA/RNA-binding domain of Phe-tRNA-synthetase-like protein